jgi:hypothetical protein
LDNKIPAKVTKALRFERNQKQKKSENHTHKAFTHRYESREMSLATVLDTETGIIFKIRYE